MLGLVLLINAVVIGLAIGRVLAWPSVAVPAGLLVVWLVACRVMVKGERAAARPNTTTAPVVADLPETTDSPLVSDVEALEADVEPTAAEAASEPVAEEPARAEGAWDMVPTTLPTYVSKPAAVRRTVQTIDLDSTGVWSSGRNDLDSALAREADESERAARTTAAERRASGS